MINIYTLEKEAVKEIKEEDISNYNKKTIWIRSVKPVDEEIIKLVKLSGIPKEEFDDLLEEEDRPRLEIKKRYSLIVLKTPVTEEHEIKTVPLSIFLKNNLIITLELEKNNTLNSIKKLIDRKGGRFLFNKKPGYFLVYILDKINDEFFMIIEKISDTSEFLKKKVGEFSKKNIEHIYSINTTLSYFNRALIANVEVIKGIKNNYFRFVPVKNKAKVEDVYFDSLTLIDTESVQRGIITGLFNIESVMNNYNLNESMKRLTSIMLILMIPTLITGIYGMNIVGLPFAKNPYAFLILSSIIFIIILISFFILRKKDWI